MTRRIVEAPISDEVRAAVTSGWDAYRAATEEHGPADEWDRRVIDNAILAFVKQGHPFSVNDLHAAGLPEVRKCLISRRFIVAQNDGLVRWLTTTPSTLESTKSARVNVYKPLD